MIKKAIFLDRDGVINRAIVRNGKPYPPEGPDDLEILPGVEDSLKRLKNVGYIIIVVSNQPDVARRKTSRDVVDKINTLLGNSLPIDQFRMCFHDDGDGCRCRKPLPGMLVEAANELGIDLGRSIMVGDRWRDIEAGANAGCRTFFIDYGYDEKMPDRFDYSVQSLAEACEIILLDHKNSGLNF
ncbi:MAG: Histidinol-phosphate phosphatase [Leptospirillum rubarum]|nr:MAG: Histidinol-phosphate phosphatase [Leptospirillum rubarum]